MCESALLRPSLLNPPYSALSEPDTPTMCGGVANSSTRNSRSVTSAKTMENFGLFVEIAMETYALRPRESAPKAVHRNGISGCIEGDCICPTRPSYSIWMRV